MKPKDLPHTFQRNLKSWRTNRNLTVRQLAVKLGASPASIIRWESGEMSPTLDTVVKIAEALRISPEALLSDIEPAAEPVEILQTAS